MTGQESESQPLLLPLWLVFMCAALALATWIGALSSVAANAKLLAVFLSVIAITMTYLTVLAIAFRGRYRRAEVRIAYLLIGLVSLVEGYSLGFATLCLMAGIGFCGIAAYIPVQFRRHAKRFTDE